MAASVILSTSFSRTHHPSLFSSISFSKPKPISQRSSYFSYPNSKPLSFSHSSNFSFVTHSSLKEKESTFVGEDSAVFDLTEQKITSWIYFAAILGVVLFILNVLWIDNSTGFGKAFVDAVSGLSDSHEVLLFSTLFTSPFHCSFVISIDK